MFLVIFFSKNISELVFWGIVLTGKSRKMLDSFLFATFQGNELVLLHLPKVTIEVCLYFEYHYRFKYIWCILVPCNYYYRRANSPNFESWSFFKWAPVSCWHDPRNLIIFLFSVMNSVLGTSCAVPASDLELTISSRSTVSFFKSNQ